MANFVHIKQNIKRYIKLRSRLRRTEKHRHIDRIIQTASRTADAVLQFEANQSGLSHRDFSHSLHLIASKGVA